MDLILILVGMSFGGMVGWMAAQADPNMGLELRVMLALLGSSVGAAGGYFLALGEKKASASGSASSDDRFQPQIVGSYCGDCGGRILLISDGQICTDCGRVFCTECEREMPCSTCRDDVARAAFVDQSLKPSTGVESNHVKDSSISTSAADSDVIPTGGGAAAGGTGGIVVRQCQHCGIRVIPKVDGRCPACRHAMLKQ